jgi:hypothetical protein
MKNKTKMMIISGIAGAFGGLMGAVSGSNSLLVIIIVSAFFGALAGFGISSFLK